MKIAIIGTGIAGNVAAYKLHQQHEVTVFEANDYIGGHSHTILETPVKVGRTWIAQTGTKAVYVGVVEVTLGDDGRVSNVEGGLHLIDRQRYAPDPEVAKVVGKLGRVDRFGDHSGVKHIYR